MENIKERRKELGLTQIELAKRVGVSMVTIQLWERGAAKPTEENEERLKSVLEADSGEENESTGNELTGTE